MANYGAEQKLEVCIARHQTLHEYYTLLSKLCVVCIRKGLRLIVENPYTQPHYLNSYWCIEPTLIDKNRRLNGDYYSKPTQYFFINCEPNHNFIFEPIEHVEARRIDHQTSDDGMSRTVMRSLIHPQYANRFIRQFILEEGA